jgi:hypothetical protein
MQCSIAAFDGLLPEPHNTIVMTLLFRLAQWHALAKLRVHTESSLAHLKTVTTEVGRQLRKFRDTTCSAFGGAEPEANAASHGRRSRHSKKNTDQGPAMNLFTYKYHAMGDYEATIRTFGTTDSYSTQIVCANFPSFRLCLDIPHLGRTRAQTSEKIIWTHKQEQCHRTNCEARATASSFSTGNGRR